MTIQQKELRTASVRSSQTAYPRTLSEALSQKKKTAFLCHSHTDRSLALGLQVLMNEAGWDVYIDWQDNDMPSTPNKETAEKIKLKIKTLDLFLFLATQNSTASRWCPWEIGYADSVKGHDNLLIIPTEDDYGRWHGNEYLQLYKRISDARSSDGGSGYAVFEPGETKGDWVQFY